MLHYGLYLVPKVAALGALIILGYLLAVYM